MATQTRIKLILLSLLFLVAIAGVFVFADVLINPGPLISGHQKLDTRCMDCHSPMFGISDQKCVYCHQVEKIGLAPPRGADASMARKPAGKPSAKTAFHHKLKARECSACHTDHQGRKPSLMTTRFEHALLPDSEQKNCGGCHTSPKDQTHQRVGDNCAQCHKTSAWKPATFEHSLLPEARLNDCQGCHAKPADKLHQYTGTRCEQCHKTTAWKPATFEHSLLPEAQLRDCQGCHAKPDDNLHQYADRACEQCHKTTAWKPATLDHDKYFRFDRRHPAECATCHQFERYEQYTCYGCHEHSPRKIIREHREEGIREFSQCTACHRSSSEREAKRLWRDMKRRGIDPPLSGGAQPWLEGQIKVKEKKSRKKRKRSHDDD